ncbi:carbamoyltransferase N-terminal domain-containing protein [Streptomyces sp. WAC04114]|uniref:carbamoyltransferase N-terminal domain-containing protein n=1 Tax=Streptomyces sp. WAC04114 TaxID=2867961 RepID=UPI001C8BCA6C|nr:carbamoyltransferase N-terminal domain-containing protein [Streptomyces sp. WAC04114]MBX9363147.1 nodulation protein U [Streptomyces sp. WAC04114]
MIICGVKLTHDGGVALIDDGRLIFSIEMEKLANNPRHQSIDDMQIVVDLLAEYGYRLEDVDRLVLDGWGRTHMVKPWGAQEVLVELAPYRRGLLDNNLLRPYPSRFLDLEYTSYPHYAGHVASAYCSSPFARSQEPSYILCWDGAMFPVLYHYDAATNVMDNVGAVHYMLGDTYHILAQHFPPFDAPIEWPHTLDLPGKIMAYVAYGNRDEKAVDALRTLYDEVERKVFPDGRPTDDHLTEAAGRQIMSLMDEGLNVPGISPEDMIASVHAFLGETLIDGLRAAIETDGRGTRNLCLVGGCALNIKWNRDVRAADIVDRVWIPPFPNDAGSALGTACCELLNSKGPKRLEWDTYAGPALVASEALPGWQCHPCTPAELAAWMYEMGDPVVVLHGRAELGPRALGHRSILAPAVASDMKHRLNEIKGREAYRPVAPICREDRVSELFAPGTPDPYMLFDQEVRPEWQEKVPAICHLDGTARVQTVGPENNSFVYEVLDAYERLSGIPLLCNTSANHNGSGFFPDVRSAMEWGRIPAIWSDGVLYERAGE